MNKRKYSGFIAGGIFLLLVLFAVITYNKLVKAEEKVQLQWNEVNNVYQRRMDLVPNLVNIVKGQADYEKETFVKITEARSKAIAVTTTTNDPTAANIEASDKAQNELATAANRVIAVIEKYPELKGTEAFRGLQTQLEGTERRVKFARKDFNEAVASYNSAIRSFPTNLIAGIFGFKTKTGFQSDTDADKAVEIKF